MAGWAKEKIAGGPSAAWLNVGIAGHSTLSVGSVRLAERIVEVGSGRAESPPALAGVEIATDALYTVDEPELRYLLMGLYDMEASGFLRAASRGVARELVQVLKIVSDNPSSPPSRLDRRTISQLVAGALGEIEQTVAALGELAGRAEARSTDVERRPRRGLHSTDRADLRSDRP